MPLSLTVGSAWAYSSLPQRDSGVQFGLANNVVQQEYGLKVCVKEVMASNKYDVFSDNDEFRVEFTNIGGVERGDEDERTGRSPEGHLYSQLQPKNSQSSYSTYNPTLLGGKRSEKSQVKTNSVKKANSNDWKQGWDITVTTFKEDNGFENGGFCCQTATVDHPYEPGKGLEFTMNAYE